jgi:di/tricarboxylate transporter
MADLRPDRLTTYQSDRKLVVSRRPGVLYFSILLHCIVQWVSQVMFLSACSFIVLVFTVFHYMFRPTWPSSGV